jgi:hypothetical protein
MRTRHIFFAALPSLLAIGLVIFAWARLEPHKTAEEKGKDLNQRAWEASFSERGLNVPPGGPRDGYWQMGLAEKRLIDSPMRWHEIAVKKPGILQIDDDGRQHWQSEREPTTRIIVVGGSVAFGAYASREDATWFSVMGGKLEALGISADITVLAAGAWKSPNELDALSNYAEAFDLAVFVNGLNDLAVQHEGDPYEPGDMTNRAQHYLMHMRRSAEICRERQARMLVVLQPCLYELTNPSPIERELIRTAYSHKNAKALFQSGYQIMRDGLTAMAERGDIRFFDASRTFNDEKYTSFCDVWHFTDPLQAIFGERLTAEVQRSLEQQPVVPVR